MSNYNSLKSTIDANIKQNGRQEITGQILNSVLNQMVTTLGAGYQFAGVATTATNPGTPDAKVFYIANGKGTYTNFGSLEVTEDDVVVLYWDSSWHKVSTGIASQEKLTELESEVNGVSTEKIIQGSGSIVFVSLSEMNWAYGGIAKFSYNGNIEQFSVYSSTKDDVTGFSEKLDIVDDGNNSYHVTIPTYTLITHLAFNAPYPGTTLKVIGTKSPSLLEKSNKYTDDSVKSAKDSVLDFANPRILEYKGSRAETRGQIDISLRKKGIAITYVENGKTITEVFTGTNFSDVYWKDEDDNNRLWYSLEDNDLYENGISTDLYKHISNYEIRNVKVYGNVNSVFVMGIFQYIAGDSRYYLVVDVNGTRLLAVLENNKEQTLRFESGDYCLLLTIYYGSGYVNVFKDIKKSYLQLCKVESAVTAKIVPQDTQFVPSEYFNSSQFPTYYEPEKFISVGHNGISFTEYGAAAALREEYYIKLYGGTKYNVRRRYVTDATGDLLYASNKTDIVDAYSVERKNEIHNGDYVDFEVNLSNRSGVYYLRLSTLNGLNINGTSVRNVDDVVEGYMPVNEVVSNDLSTCIDKKLLYSGNYGDDNAVYKVDIKSDLYRIAFDFKIKFNANNDNKKNNYIARFSSKGSIQIHSSNISLLQSKYASDNMSYVQELNYNSTIRLTEMTNTVNEGVIDIERKAKTTKPIRGNGVIAIWLKGDFANPQSLIDSLTTRANWLENNQDYALVIENDTLSIIKDGVGFDGGTFNGGNTSTIFTTSLKSGGSWKSLSELMNELKALDYISVKMLDASSSYNCGDLLQFGKVKLVGRYNQQINRDSPTLAYYYDSFPFIVRTAIDESTHTVEIVSFDGHTYISIDGYTTEKTPSIDNYILIGNEDGTVVCSNLEVWDGTFGDDVSISTDIASKKQIVSKRTPYMVGIMGHRVYDTYKGSGEVVKPNTNSSLTQVEDVMRLINNKGYKAININGIVESVQHKPNDSRMAFVVYDDNSIEDLWDNDSIRNAIDKYGIPQNFAIIHSSVNADVTTKTLPMALHGWQCTTHSLKHDVPMPQKNSVILYYELGLIQGDCKQYLFVPNVLTFNWQGLWENLYNVLEIKGYVAAINSSNDCSWGYTHPYFLGRRDMSDSTNILDIDKVLL